MSASDAQPYSLKVSRGVVEAIVRFAALEVEGVAGLAERPSVERLFLRPRERLGVRLDVREGAATIDLYLLLRRGVDMRQVSSRVQTAVHEAVTQLVGMPVREVNVHVQDVR